MIIRPAKEPRRVEGKVFLPYTPQFAFGLSRLEHYSSPFSTLPATKSPGNGASPLFVLHSRQSFCYNELPCDAETNKPLLQMPNSEPNYTFFPQLSIVLNMLIPFFFFF